MIDPAGLLNEADARADAAPDGALTLRRVFTVAPPVLWALFTDPARFSAWWGPRGSTCFHCALDLREGGAWRTDLRSAAGEIHVIHGTYRAIEAPTRLAFTWAFGPPDAPTTPVSEVELHFAARGRGSELALFHRRLDPAMRAGHEAGWGAAFESLSDLLAAETPDAGAPAMLKPNPFNWVTIPVADMDRAVGFYAAVFGLDLSPQDMGDETMAMFPAAEGAMGAAGCLWKGVSATGFAPGDAGPEPVFACASDLSEALSRVEAAGGKVLSEKTSLGPNGFLAHILDSEGNRVGLHSDV